MQIDLGQYVTNEAQPNNAGISLLNRFYSDTGLIPCIWRTVFPVYKESPELHVVKTCPVCYQYIISMYEAEQQSNDTVTYYLALSMVDGKMFPVIISKSTANSIWLAIAKEASKAKYAFTLKAEDTFDNTVFILSNSKPCKPAKVANIFKLLSMIMTGAIKFTDSLPHYGFILLPFDVQGMQFYFLPIYFHRPEAFPSVGMSYLSDLYANIENLSIEKLKSFFEE